MINADQAKLLVWFDYMEKFKQMDLILQNAVVHESRYYYYFSWYNLYYYCNNSTTTITTIFWFISFRIEGKFFSNQTTKP